LFLAVGLFRPHIPWEVPQKWFDLHPLAEVKLPRTVPDDLADAHEHGRRAWHRWVVENKLWEKFMQGYLASISYLDHQVGRLLDALDASPLKDNTIVVLWSDHGFHIGEKENWEKFALWDQTTRVPLFIAAPGVARAGTRTRAPASLIDLYPTLCELAGLPVPAQCGGLSLVPQLRDGAARRERVALSSHVFAGENAASHAVADERYRLIRYGNGMEELYDLVADPDEFTNRAKDPALAEVKARLAGALPTDAAAKVGVPVGSALNLPSAKKGKKQAAK
jgi:arylsulfatase A-like enzyme